MDWLARGSAVALLALAVALAAGAQAADTGSGTLTYKGRTSALKYAWLVSGPSDMEPGKTVRRVILSATDISAKLAACKTFSCTDGAVTEGTTLDFTGGPRINYWIAMNDQKVQYSGTATPDAFAARVNEPAHLAGKLAIDDVSAGGPKLDAQFDLERLREFKVAR
jgi:hypothetical protein